MRKSITIYVQELYKYNIHKKFIKYILSYKITNATTIICKSKKTGTKVELKVGGNDEEIKVK